METKKTWLALSQCVKNDKTTISGMHATLFYIDDVNKSKVT